MTATDLPKEILEKAVGLRNSVRLIYLALARVNKPSTAEEIAKIVGHGRPYVNMRLIQLVDRGLVKSTPSGKKNLFEVVMNAPPSPV